MHFRDSVGFILLCATGAVLVGCGRSSDGQPQPRVRAGHTAPEGSADRAAANQEMHEVLCGPKEGERFQGLIRATLKAIDAGPRAGVVSTITALEAAWDAQEEALEPRHPAVWRTLDVTLDRAIAALRGSATDLAKGRAALRELRVGLQRATADHALKSVPHAVRPQPTALSDPAAVYDGSELEPFRNLTRKTLAFLDGGRTDDGIAALTDLEAAWDAAEGELKGRDPGTWALLDRTLDRAIDALRSTHEMDAVAGRAALADLLARFGQATRGSKARGR